MSVLFPYHLNYSCGFPSDGHVDRKVQDAESRDVVMVTERGGPVIRNLEAGN